MWVSQYHPTVDGYKNYRCVANCNMVLFHAQAINGWIPSLFSLTRV